METASVWLFGTERIFHKNEFEEIINANEFNLEKDFKYQLMCGICSSPATFVCHKDGRKYFRHPKRSSNALREKDKNCERRSKNTSKKSIRNHNQIIEQTTLREYADNFKKIYASINHWSKDELQCCIDDAKHISVLKLFKSLDELNKHQLSKLKDKFPDKFIKANELNKLSFKEKFHFYYNDTKEIYEKKQSDIDTVFPTMSAILNFIKPENCLICELAYKKFHYDINSDSLIWKNNDYKKIYPLEHHKQLEELPKLMNMLFHEKSEEMLHWLVYSYLITFFQIKNENLSLSDLIKFNSYTKLKYFLGGCFFLAYRKSYREKFSDWEEKYKGYKSKLIEILDLEPYYCASLIPSIVSEILTAHKLEQWYKAIQEVKEKELEYEKTKSGFIYVAVNNDVYRDGDGFDDRTKIGETKKIEKRKDDYKTYSADGFLFMKTWFVKNRFKAEKMVKNELKRFKKKNGAGEEWYVLTVEETLIKVEKVIKKYIEREGYFQDDYYKNAGKGFT